jgi:hypothetical protein
MGEAVAEEKVTLKETSMRIAASKNKRQQRTSGLVANRQYNDVPPCSVFSAGRFCLIILKPASIVTHQLASSLRLLIQRASRATRMATRANPSSGMRPLAGLGVEVAVAVGVGSEARGVGVHVSVRVAGGLVESVSVGTGVATAG